VARMFKKSPKNNTEATHPSTTVTGAHEELAAKHVAIAELRKEYIWFTTKMQEVAEKAHEVDLALAQLKIQLQQTAERRQELDTLMHEANRYHDKVVAAIDNL
jgi:hypothetical protein